MARPIDELVPDRARRCLETVTDFELDVGHTVRVPPIGIPETGWTLR